MFNEAVKAGIIRNLGKGIKGDVLSSFDRPLP